MSISSFCKRVFRTLAVVVGLALLAGSVFAADAPLPGGIFIAVKGPPGIGVSFSVNGANNVAMYWTKGDGITKPNADGFYMVKVPDLDWSKARKVCASVVSSKLFGKGDCISWSKTKKFPANGIIILPEIK